MKSIGCSLLVFISCYAHAQTYPGDANTAEKYNVRGNDYVKSYNFSDAVANYDEAIRLNPREPVYYANRAYAKYYGLEKYDEALADYDMAIRYKPNEPTYYNSKGIIYYNQRKYAEAIRNYTLAINLDPKNAVMLNNRAGCEYLLKEYENAISDLDQIIRLDPSNMNHYNDRGNNKYSLGHYEDAIPDYTMAINLAPKEAVLYANRAGAKFAAGRYEDAIPDYDQALYLSPGNDAWLNTRGVSKNALGHYDEAIVDYTLAINKNAKNADYFANRGRAKELLYEFDEALLDYDRAILLNPNNSTYYYSRGIAERYTKEYSASVKDFDKAIQLNPILADGYAFRAISKSKLRQFESAMEDCRTALALDPKCDNAYSSQSEIYLGLGKLPEALEAVNKAIDLKIADIRLNRRGYIYFKMGQYSNAIQDYDEAIKMGGFHYHPEYVYRDEAAASLNRREDPRTTPGNNYFVNLQWIRPVDNINELPNGVYKVAEGNELKIRVKALSSMRLSADNFHLVMDGRDISGSKMTVVDLQDVSNSQDGNQYEYEYNSTLKLERGSSRISVAAEYNNYKKITQQLQVDYYPEQVNLHILSIGTRSNLKYPQKDARDFARIFSTQAGEGKLFRTVEVDTLIGDAATAGNIAAKMAELASRSFNGNDVLVIFISAHGIVQSDGLRLMGSDFDSRLWSRTSVNYRNEISEPLQNMNCKRIIFLDACHSGAANDMATGSKSASNLEVNTAINNLINAGNDVNVITSSSDDQVSWEDDAWQNGAFTKAIREALEQGRADQDKNGIIRIRELVEYIKARVPEMVTGAGKALQTPKWNSKTDISIYIR
ncbi:MAG: tetratricopeptide repeat protein [Puia sp.]|nr:tetratricopeptide repeat protein [Puia sp.]